MVGEDRIQDKKCTGPLERCLIGFWEQDEELTLTALNDLLGILDLTKFWDSNNSSLCLYLNFYKIPY